MPARLVAGGAALLMNLCPSLREVANPARRLLARTAKGVTLADINVCELFRRERALVRGDGETSNYIFMRHAAANNHHMLSISKNSGT